MKRGVLDELEERPDDLLEEVLEYPERGSLRVLVYRGAYREESYLGSYVVRCLESVGC